MSRINYRAISLNWWLALKEDSGSTLSGYVIRARARAPSPSSPSVAWEASVKPAERQYVLSGSVGPCGGHYAHRLQSSRSLETIRGLQPGIWSLEGSVRSRLRRKLDQTATRAPIPSHPRRHGRVNEGFLQSQGRSRGSGGENQAGSDWSGRDDKGWGHVCRY